MKKNNERARNTFISISAVLVANYAYIFLGFRVLKKFLLLDLIKYEIIAFITALIIASICDFFCLFVLNKKTYSSESALIIAMPIPVIMGIVSLCQAKANIMEPVMNMILFYVIIVALLVIKSEFTSE